MNRFKNAIKRNIPMKIMALVFAFILWNVVLIINDPQRIKRIDDISIIVQNADRIGSELIITDELNEIFDKADVEVSVKLSELDNLTKDKITVYANLLAINDVGEYNIRLSATSGVGSVVKIDPEFVTVHAETNYTGEVQLNIELTGKLEDKLYLSNYETPYMQTIKISGRSEYVKKAAKAVCEVDLTKVTKSENRSYEIRILDHEGNDITSYLKNNTSNTAIVKVEVLAKKRIPIKVSIEDTLSDTSKIAKDYRIIGVRALTQYIEIVGQAELIDSIETLHYTKISVRDWYETTEAILKFSIPEGVFILNGTEVKVVVEIEKIPEANYEQ